MSTREAWLSDEPRFSTAAADLVFRAARRPWATLAFAALAALALVGLGLARPPAYVATVTFLMEEGDLHDPVNAPRPPSRIREYITNVALSRDRLLSLMERHGIMREFREQNPLAAIALLRERISIAVVRNYFLFDRQAVGEPRSARIVLSFTAGDRTLAQAVVHDIGTLFVESQTAARNAHLQRARDISSLQAQRAHEQVRAVQRQRARIVAREPSGGGDAEARALAEAVSLKHELDRALLRSAGTGARAADLRFASIAEGQRLWLDVKLVDEDVAPVRKPIEREEVPGRAALMFALALPLSVGVVGGFDRRIHRAGHAASHGLALLGTMPRYPRDNAASHLERSRWPPRRRAETI